MSEPTLLDAVEQHCGTYLMANEQFPTIETMPAKPRLYMNIQLTCIAGAVNAGFAGTG